MINTAHDPGSMFWCHAVVSLQLTHAAPLPAEPGCHAYKRIVLLLVFIVLQ